MYCTYLQNLTRIKTKSNKHETQTKGQKYRYMPFQKSSRLLFKIFVEITPKNFIYFFLKFKIKWNSEQYFASDIGNFLANHLGTRLSLKEFIQLESWYRYFTVFVTLKWLSFFFAHFYKLYNISETNQTILGLFSKSQKRKTIVVGTIIYLFFL